MTNKKLGNDFESAFCEILFENGFWSHNMAQNSSGQPADVIAVRNGKPFLIDCKVCSNKGFALSRVEENQNLSMELWKGCGNGEGWFAVLFREQHIYMIPHIGIKALAHQQSYMTEADAAEYGFPLDKWLRKVKKK